MKTILSIITLLIFLNCCKNAVDNNNEKYTRSATWWKEAVIYQIYPRSFKDSDGDGVGDLKGIIEKVDYIKSLGVDAVWLNPIYSSPNDDNGYDVSDYKNIMAEFGTMNDFDTLLKLLHQRGIKVIMDIVVNHSSDEHLWFKEARSSRTNQYRNYYHWWPAERGKPNYRYSLFDEKGDAWQYDSLTNSYYLHYFSRKQPDLNWENPALRKEVYGIMRFWAEKGVDGFRLDAFQFAAKDTSFPPFPNGFEREFTKYYALQGNLHEYLKEMNKEIFDKYGVMSVAEGAGNNFEDAHNLVDEERKELNMAYAFEGVDIAKPEGYSLFHFKNVFTKWDSAFAKKGWLSIFLSNHDQARLVSRFGNDNPEFRTASISMLNTFLLTMRGTPYCYFGDELGMTNSAFKLISEFKDIAAINGYKKAVREGQNIQEFMKILQFSARDNGRTPMQWDSSLHAGFTKGTPWLPVNKNYQFLNVAEQEKDSSSSLALFKKLVQLRKNNPALVYGNYAIIQRAHPSVYAYTRTLEDKKLLVVLNFSNKPTSIDLREISLKNTVMFNNCNSFNLQKGTLFLQPFQSLIITL